MNKKLFIFLGFIMTFFFCGKESNDFVDSINQFFKDYNYTKVINTVADSLRKNPEMAEETKKEIYIKYALSIAMKSEGAIHYTLLDSLKKYGLEDEYKVLKDNFIKNVSGKVDKAKELAEAGNIKEALENLSQAAIIFPSNRNIIFLTDSLNRIINKDE